MERAKKYVKPDLFYEDFQLSRNVASCSVEDDDSMTSANLSDGNSCYYDFWGAVLFNTSTGSCELDYSDLEGYCYQTGSAGYSFFHS